MAERSTGPLWESKNGWQLHRLPFGAAMVSLVIAGLLIAPSVGNWFAANSRAQALTAHAEIVEQTPESELETLLSQARVCNDAMESLAYVFPSFAVPQESVDDLDEQLVGAGSSHEVSARWAEPPSECEDAFSDDLGQASYSSIYDASLNLGDGVLARLTIPRIGVDTPVHHWVDEESLSDGVGHVPSSSFPVGGETTNAVLVGHDAGLFADLGRVQVGDRLTLQVMGETLTYRIISSEVVEVDQTVPVEAVAGEDHVTLITAPGANILAQHRLVTAERVQVADEELEALAAPVSGGGFPWWLVGVLAAVGLLGLAVWWSGRPLEDEEGTTGAAVDAGRQLSGSSGTLSGDGESEEDIGIRSVSSFAGDPAFQEYLANYQMDPRTEAELWDDETEDSSYRNVRQKQ